jgi:hypothetical protein
MRRAITVLSEPTAHHRAGPLIQPAVGMLARTMVPHRTIESVRIGLP